MTYAQEHNNITAENIIMDTRMNIAEWFARKNELGGTSVYVILKETEKAVYAICGNMFGRMKTTWIPKSLITSEESKNNRVLKNVSWEVGIQFIKDEKELYM